VVHSPFGSRMNRAWGLALRKRFCRTFNFELQAAATEDAIVLSLSTSHSFPLEEVAHYLRSATAREVLIQALLDAPLFGVRWRWNATTALALPRFVGGRKVAPQLQRMKSEDLLASVFPDQVACAENIGGDRDVPDHPLVAQTMHDCLHEAMDCDGWLAVLRGIESGAIEVIARDLPAPSPLAAEALTARPYAYLDDAPIEERRTQAVQNRRFGDAGNVDQMGALDAEAIAGVREEAWPSARGADEVHEALMTLGAITEAEARANDHWEAALALLARGGRATRLVSEEVRLWVAAERLATMRRLYPRAAPQPPIAPPGGYEAGAATPEEALRELLRARLGGLGPVTVDQLVAQLGLPRGEIEFALAALQSEGSVFQGHVTPGMSEVEWCERHLLARIHRYTLKRLRREIEPVEPRDFVRFLFEWQHVAADARVSGPEALPAVLAQLEGFEAPASLWEAEVLPARVKDYASSWLDDLCTAGRTMWTRLRPVASGTQGGGRSSLRTTPILLLPRRATPTWARLASAAAVDDEALGGRAQRVFDFLETNGASFFDEIADGARLLRAELEDALAELVVRGRANCDSYAGLRALLVPAAKRASAASRSRRRVALFGIEDAGRWNVIRSPHADDAKAAAEAIEHVARTLLRRYGVVCFQLLEREAAWMPPWRELVRIYRRLEARGEIRGGRFIGGVTGEQFALPDAIATMRAVRRQPPDETMVCLSASDPANLLGTVLHGPKVPRVAGSRVLYRDGLAIGTSIGGQIELLVPLDAAQARAATRALALDPQVRFMEQAAAAARDMGLASS
jgi:ATP-dependent Lhr-like helicase